jgi:hypothetical protein
VHRSPFPSSALILCCLMFALASGAQASDPSQPQSRPNPNPLVQILLSKGVLSSAEAATLTQGHLRNNRVV